MVTDILTPPHSTMYTIPYFWTFRLHPVFHKEKSRDYYIIEHIHKTCTDCLWSWPGGSHSSGAGAWRRDDPSGRISKGCQQQAGSLSLESTQNHLPTRPSLLQSNRTVCLGKGMKKSYMQRQRNSGALLHASKLNIKYRRPLTRLRMLGVAGFTVYFQPPFRDAVGPP